MRYKLALRSTTRGNERRGGDTYSWVTDHPNQRVNARLVSGSDQCHRRAGMHNISFIGLYLGPAALVRHGGQESGPCSLCGLHSSCHAGAVAPALVPAAGRARTRTDCRALLRSWHHISMSMFDVPTMA